MTSSFITKLFSKMNIILHAPQGVQHYRFLSRRSRRKVVNIISPAEELKLSTNPNPQNRNLNKQSPKTKPPQRGQLTNSDPSEDKIMKLDINDRRFGPVISRAKVRSQRSRRKEILLEGKRLIRDAFLAGALIKSIFVCDVGDAAEFSGCNIARYLVSRSQMKLWSDLVTPPGIMAICEMPTHECVMTRMSTIPITLICDNIRDPGNMGTIIRLAAAAQCDKVLLPQGCVDVWDPKVLRSAMGCHFRVPLYCNLPWSSVINYLSHDTTALLADVSRNPAPRVTNDSQETSRDDDIVAERNGKFQYSRDVMNIMRGASTVDEGDDSETESDEDYSDSKLQLYSQIPLNSKAYYEVDFASGHHTVVVCNESVGPSMEARKLVYDKYGEIVAIPTDAGVESLNCAMATAVIVFEARRQLLSRAKYSDDS